MTLAAMDTDEALGQGLMALIGRLYPICRSITGPGVRETLAILQESIPLQVQAVASGTEVYDWTIPMNGRSATPMWQTWRANA